MQITLILTDEIFSLNILHYLNANLIICNLEITIFYINFTHHNPQSFSLVYRKLHKNNFNPTAPIGFFCKISQKNPITLLSQLFLCNSYDFAKIGE